MAFHACHNSCRRVPAVNHVSSSTKTFLRIASLLMLLIAIPARGQDQDAKTPAKPDSGSSTASSSPSKDVRLTIIVIGGEDQKPIDSASVYIRFVEERKHRRDKKVEMNLKTNQAGVCHVPVIPPGKFVIQVIADGWKTYGEYYDLSETEQTIHITLVRPPKWY